jgi:hypothetical protein
VISALFFDIVRFNVFFLIEKMSKYNGLSLKNISKYNGFFLMIFQRFDTQEIGKKKKANSNPNTRY